MIFKEKLQTANITMVKGKPVVMTPRYIIIHSTGTGLDTLKGNLRTLMGETIRPVSAHFLVDGEGNAYKLSEPTFICWHAGVSEWKGEKDLNRFSIGIEVLGLDKFTDPERKTTKELILHLMKTYGIPKENVLRHADIAPGRKTDVHENFYKPEFKTFEDWKNAKLKI